MRRRKILSIFIGFQVVTFVKVLAHSGLDGGHIVMVFHSLGGIGNDVFVFLFG